MMELKTLELRIISATDLDKPSTFSSKLEPYVVVSLSPDSYSAAAAHTKTTPVDAEGGRNPLWNHRLSLPLHSSAAAASSSITLVFEIRHRRRSSSDKVIGEVHVPLSDLLVHSSSSPAPAPASSPGKQVSYQVKRPVGKPKGYLTFAYSFSGPGSPPSSPPGKLQLPQAKLDVYTPPPSAPPCYTAPPQPVSCYTTTLPPPQPPKVSLYPTVYDEPKKDVYLPPAPAAVEQVAPAEGGGAVYAAHCCPCPVPQGQAAYGYPVPGGYGYPVQGGYGYPVQGGYGPYGYGYGSWYGYGQGYNC